jgi:hypothetical protein
VATRRCGAGWEGTGAWCSPSLQGRAASCRGAFIVPLALRGWALRSGLERRYASASALSLRWVLPCRCCHTWALLDTTSCVLRTPGVRCDVEPEVRHTPGGWDGICAWEDGGVRDFVLQRNRMGLHVISHLRSRIPAESPQNDFGQLAIILLPSP